MILPKDAAAGTSVVMTSMSQSSKDDWFVRSSSDFAVTNFDTGAVQYMATRGVCTVLTSNIAINEVQTHSLLHCIVQPDQQAAHLRPRE